MQFIAFSAIIKTVKEEVHNLTHTKHRKEEHKMKIVTRLEALHALCTLRRMEINGEDISLFGQRKYDAIYTACENFFGENDPVFERFANGHR